MPPSPIARIESWPWPAGAPRPCCRCWLNDGSASAGVRANGQSAQRGRRHSVARCRQRVERFFVAEREPLRADRACASTLATRSCTGSARSNALNATACPGMQTMRQGRLHRLLAFSSYVPPAGGRSHGLRQVDDVRHTDACGPENRVRLSHLLRNRHEAHNACTASSSGK
jgi:hypothetical protein